MNSRASCYRKRTRIARKEREKPSSDHDAQLVALDDAGASLTEVANVAEAVAAAGASLRAEVGKLDDEFDDLLFRR